MKASFFFLIGIFLCTANNLLSQSFEVPKDYVFKTAPDYVTYEKDIIAATNWLIATPLKEQSDKRKEVSAFVVQWVNGSPTVSVELNATILDFEKKNTGMMVLFMAASAKYVLENNYSKDIRAKQKAALRSMMGVYKAGLGIKKDKKMEKLIKSDAEGKIEEWLDEYLKIGE
jgi:hypothetical protein